MNERIRELAEQAEFSEKDLHIQGDNFQMFAELIVKECADAITKDSRLNDVRSAANGCVSVIKEHFGVE